MKISWVIGAGASKEAFYPLVRDFLDDEYIKKWEKITLATFGNSFNYITSDLLRDVAKLKEFGRDINEVMFNALRSDNMPLYEQSLLHIHKLFQLIQLYYTDNYSLQYMDAFVQILYTTNSSVISLNYDQLIEERLSLHYFGMLENEAWSLARKEHSTDAADFFDRKDFHLQNILKDAPNVYDYGVFSKKLKKNFAESEGIIDSNSGYLYTNIDENGIVKILKPHGSISWYKCNVCHSILNLPRILVGAKEGTLSHGLAPTHKINFMCPTCLRKETLVNAIVPPTRNESLPFADDLKDIWNEIESDLSASDIWIVAGYSFPKEDVEFRKAVENQTRSNRQVIYVDPYLDDTRRQNLQELFGSVYFVEKTFSDFLGYVILLSVADLTEASSKLDRVIKSVFGYADRENTRAHSRMRLSSSLISIAEDETASIWQRRRTIEMLGFTRNEQVRSFLTDRFHQHFISDLRASLVKALENFPSPETLQLIGVYLFDNEPIQQASDNLHRVTNPVSAFAYITLNNLLKKECKLRYDHIIYILLYIAQNARPDGLSRQRANKSLDLALSLNAPGIEFITGKQYEDEMLRNESYLIIHQYRSIYHKWFDSPKE